ncbi:FAD-dependent oxidoreductase [Paenibacillus cymbidii]|uniref:FAD-dependent oxidoreductase n=1 Tax=Paenibacillus cymbidii TaxID=1639034 RepID=UPI0010807EC9|nr:FAD-dependent oxidoreductase [Paenibacillus cymbidii]
MDGKAETTAESVMEQAKRLPLAGSYDAIVCGGGPAGVAAALAAARAGARVLLIELHGCLGGVWTAGALSWIIDAGNKPGLMRELTLRMERQRVSRDGAGGADSFAYDPERMKRLLEAMCLEAGVDILLHARVCGALKDESGRLTHVLVESKSGRQAYSAAAFVDATGDGDLAAQAGCAFESGRPDNGETQPMSLMALLAGITFDAAGRFCMNNGIAEDGRKLLLAELARVGVRPSYAAPSLIHIREGLFALMANHEYGVPATDAAAITKATLRARAEVHAMVDALRAAGGIWAGLALVATAGQIGVREGRRIRGRYRVDVNDVATGARHPDAVARVTFWTDIHATNPARGQAYGDDGVRSQPYDIPLRALIAADADGLLLAGRCISGDFFAHASYRVTGNAVAMGEAAGVTAALSAKSGALPQDVPWELVRQQLERLREG